MGLLGGDDKSWRAAFDANLKNNEMLQQIALPDYDEWVPELFDNESANYKLTSEDPVMKSRQLEALAKFQDLAETGMSDQDAAGFMKARAMGDQMAKGKTDAAIADAQARGVAGGGQEFAMREAAAQAGAQRAQEAAMAQAAQSAQQRQQYLNAYANQLGNVRDQDYRTQAANTDVINRFNQFNTQQRNATNQANTGLKNSAFQYNQDLKDKNYQNQMGKYDRFAGFNNRQAEIESAQEQDRRKRGAAMTGLVGGIAGGIMGGPAGAAAGSQIGSALY